MKKNPFKKQGAMDTLVSVGIGGAANSAYEYVYNMATESMTEQPSDTVKECIKIAIGVLGGTMTNNKYLGAAARGIATVGASNLVASLIEGDETEKKNEGNEGSAGLPGGTIGRVLPGNRAYRRVNRKVSGLQGGFMGE